MKINYVYTVRKAEREGAVGRRALNRGGRLLSFSVTGPRRLENDLVVPGKFTASTKSVAIGRR